MEIRYNTGMILIVDCGSQTTHLIGRRVEELGAQIKIVSPEDALQIAKTEKPKGIIVSGGPASVYLHDAPTVDKKLFFLGVPVLGICYGFQLIINLLDGKVTPGKKEYGPAKLQLKTNSMGQEITKGLPKTFTVWMNHGDEVIKIPSGFQTLGETEHVPFAFVQNKKMNIYGLLFHPEVEHTEQGNVILQNFMDVCGMSGTVQSVDVETLREKIKAIVGESYVIGAVSGGVDSTVAGVLAAQVLGDHFIPVYVDNGLMRVGTTEHVVKIFKKYKIKPIVINAVGEMLKRLEGIVDSEIKRKAIGKLYIEIFEEEMKKLQKSKKLVKFLLQGTIYSDVIESKGTKHADNIKSHHNVGGLPENMKLELLEPLRLLYKDQVRSLGIKLGLADEFVYRQPFPGPGYAVRIRGEVTRERLEQAKLADKIILEELEIAGILRKVFLSFPVLTGAFSTAIKGDGRAFGEVVALRVIESKDIMTATWAYLPKDVLQKISSRIVNEVPGISRVVYDITTKPPATMEWE